MTARARVFKGGRRSVSILMPGTIDPMTCSDINIWEVVPGSANLKSWLRGCHHGVSEKHLQAYLNEFTFRFNRRFYPFNAFRSLLGIGGGAESPTYRELYDGNWQHPTASGHG